MVQEATERTDRIPSAKPALHCEVGAGGPDVRGTGWHSSRQPAETITITLDYAWRGLQSINLLKGREYYMPRTLATPIVSWRGMLAPARDRLTTPMGTPIAIRSKPTRYW